MKNAIFAVMLTTLTACDSAQSPSGTTSDTCGASRYGHLKGAPEPEILALSYNQPVRIIAPRDQITMDFLPERLNFALGADGTVAAITCG